MVSSSMVFCSRKYINIKFNKHFCINSSSPDYWSLIFELRSFCETRLAAFILTAHSPITQIFRSSLSKSCKRKIQFVFTWQMMFQSGHNFAHVTTAGLLWHVLNCDLMGPAALKLDWNKFSQDFKNKLINFCDVGPKLHPIQTTNSPAINPGFLFNDRYDILS